MSLTDASAPQRSSALDAIARVEGILASCPPAIVQLALRVAVAVPFWFSGLTKWDGFLQLSPNAVYLFSEEFKLHILGGAYAYPAPWLMAFASSLAEIILPILIVVGLMTRFAALGLLVMTAIIQLTIPDGWANFHLLWAALALAVMTYGPGAFSLDRRIGLGNPAVSLRRAPA